MYQGPIAERNGKFGLWVNGYGFMWFKSMSEAEKALKENPVI